MKRILLAIVLLFTGASVFAQTPLSEERRREVMDLLTQTAASMQTMQCRFVQEKTMTILTEPSISEGLMVYSTPDKMRWEYSSPFAFALVVDGERIVKISDGNTEVLNGKSNRMYQGMASLIMGSATGKILFDPTMFDAALYDDDAYWMAEMTPKRRDMKRMFSRLVFRFDKKTNGINRVEFVEPGGDITVIQFEDIRMNEAVDPSVFVE